MLDAEGDYKEYHNFTGLIKEKMYYLTIHHKSKITVESFNVTQLYTRIFWEKGGS